MLCYHKLTSQHLYYKHVTESLYHNHVTERIINLLLNLSYTCYCTYHKHVTEPLYHKPVTEPTTPQGYGGTQKVYVRERSHQQEQTKTDEKPQGMVPRCVIFYVYGFKSRLFVPYTFIAYLYVMPLYHILYSYFRLFS